MKVSVCELPRPRPAFEKQWSALVDYKSKARSDLIVLPPMSFDDWSTQPARKRDPRLLSTSAVHEDWNRHLAELNCSLVLGSRRMEFGNERYDEGFVWDTEHGLRSVHARGGRSPAERPRGPKEVLSEFVPMDVQGICIAFLIGAEVRAEDEVRRYGREGVELLVIQRGLSRVPFDDWFAWTREAAALSGSYVVSSHRSGLSDGHGYIIAPNGELLAQTTPRLSFASAYLELPVVREAADLEPHPAPAWIDPWVTGVPPH